MLRRTLTITLALVAALLYSSAASAGTITIAWDPNPEGDIAGYRIAYGTSPGSHPTVVDVGNQATWQLRGLQDGLRYYFVVMAYNRLGGVSAPSAEISGNVVGLTAINSDMTSPTPTGKPITWTALSGLGPLLQYQFWRFSQTTGAWTMVRNYSLSNTYTWTPAEGEEGTYAIQAWARLAGSNESFETWRTTGFFSVANGPIKVGSLASSVALPAASGTPVTWTAKASGGPMPLQYQFWKYSEVAGTWTMVQDYSTSPTYTWTPAGSDLGRHALQVWVRGAGSTAGYDAYRSSGIFEVRNSPVGVAALTSSVQFPAGTGAPITWTAVASGAGPLEYSFYRFSQSTGRWTTVQAWGPSPSYTWTAPSTGTYSLQVWVRRQGSTASYDAYRSTDVFRITNGTPTVRSITTNVAAPYGTEAPVTFSVDASGGPGPLQYSFWLYNQARDTWSQVSPYSTNPTFTWTPSQGDAGSYAMQAWVRRPATTAAYDAWGSTGLFGVGNVTASLQSVTVSEPSAAAGTPVTVAALGSGGPGSLEYKFFRYSASTGQWNVVQDYSWDSTFSWVPGTSERGSHTFQVWIRRAGSTSPYEGYLSSSPVQIN